MYSVVALPSSSAALYLSASSSLVVTPTTSVLAMPSTVTEDVSPLYLSWLVIVKVPVSLSNVVPS